MEVPFNILSHVTSPFVDDLLEEIRAELGQFTGDIEDDSAKKKDAARDADTVQVAAAVVQVKAVAAKATEQKKGTSYSPSGTTVGSEAGTDSGSGSGTGSARQFVAFESQQAELAEFIEAKGVTNRTKAKASPPTAAVAKRPPEADVPADTEAKKSMCVDAETAARM